MEQNIQQTVENKLPVKTKIATWMIIILCLCVIYINTEMFLLHIKESQYQYNFNELVKGDLMGIAIGILLICLSVILITKRKKWIWFILVIVYIIPAVFVICLILLGCSFAMEGGGNCLYLLLIPLILLPPFLIFLDRKNFWKVAK